MKSRIDIPALRNARSPAILYRALQDLDLNETSLFDLVRLKQVIANVIQKSHFKAVPEELLVQYSQMLSHRTIDLQRLKYQTDSVRLVTVVFSNVLDVTHSTVVFNFVAFLASMPQLDRIDLVLTCENVPKYWTKAEKEPLAAKVEQDLDAASADFCSADDSVETGRRKIKVTLAPEIDELTAAIGDVVIRYEGSVPRLSARLCTHSIFEQRPVIGTTGTSVIKQVPDVDVLLTPAQRPFEEKEVQYLRPLPRFPEGEALLRISPSCEQRKWLLSGYANDKLARGIKAFDDTDWDALSRLFDEDDRIRWHLFGARDTDEVWQAFPAEFLNGFASRVEVSGMVDLANVWQDGFAFLALPGVGGAGTTAKKALRNGVPVLVCRNGERDISNMFPTPSTQTAFRDLLDRLSEWGREPNKRAGFLCDQAKNINQRADFDAKSCELYDIFKVAVQRFRLRANLC